jgi:hypothetical protein
VISFTLDIIDLTIVYDIYTPSCFVSIWLYVVLSCTVCYVNYFLVNLISLFIVYLDPVTNFNINSILLVCSPHTIYNFTDDAVPREV